MEMEVKLLPVKAQGIVGKMNCEFLETEMTFTVLRETLFNSSAGKKFTIRYKDIYRLKEIEYGKFLTVLGVQIFFNTNDINFPVSPSPAVAGAGGLIGALIYAATNRKRTEKKTYMLYFYSEQDRAEFIDICTDRGELE